MCIRLTLVTGKSKLAGGAQWWMYIIFFLPSMPVSANGHDYSLSSGTFHENSYRADAAELIELIGALDCM